MRYLNTKWCDEAHILQFRSTDEYFETTEYELQTPSGVRDILWLPPNPITFTWIHQPSDMNLVEKELQESDFRWIDLQNESIYHYPAFSIIKIHVFTHRKNYTGHSEMFQQRIISKCKKNIEILLGTDTHLPGDREMWRQNTLFANLGFMIDRLLQWGSG